MVDDDQGTTKTTFENIRIMAMSWRMKLSHGEQNRMLGTIMGDLDRLPVHKAAPPLY